MKDPYSGKPWLEHYDKNVPEKLKYPKKLYSEVFRETVGKVKDRVAVYYAGAPITFTELDIMSNRFANFLREKGLKPGDVVGVHLPNVPAYFISILGILKAGCVLTGLSPLLTQRELEYQMNDSGARAMVAMDLLWGNVGPIIANTGVKVVAMAGIADFLPTDKPSAPGALPSIPGINFEHYMDIIKNYPGTQPELKMDPGASCLMQYTGGTTGPSKGATLTHNNMVHHVQQLTTWLDTKPGSITVLSAFPLFHQAGLALGMWSMAMGSTQVAVANPRDIAGVINLIKTHKPTVLVNVPTIYIELSRQPAFKEIDFSNLEWCLSGAAPFPPENIK
ncbi:MAG: AMP-binding protein, partial [Chloroflexi bacterium]|nr:AMP-binding protein [Chloroflexota bacterium]